MPLNTAGKVLAANGIAAAVTHMSLHTANPGGTGANASAAARKPITLTVDGSGNLSVSNVAFTGGAASGACTHVGFWSAITAGTNYGDDSLTGDLTFNAAGEYTVSSATLTLSAT